MKHQSQYDGFLGVFPGIVYFRGKKWLSLLWQSGVRHERRQQLQREWKSQQNTSALLGRIFANCLVWREGAEEIKCALQSTLLFLAFCAMSLVRFKKCEHQMHPCSQFL